MANQNSKRKTTMAMAKASESQQPTKRTRNSDINVNDSVPTAASVDASDASLRRSSRASRGSGGQLDQRRRLEAIQTARPTARVSPMDVALQGEAVNPMAPGATQAVNPRAKPTASQPERSANIGNNSMRQAPARPQLVPAQAGSKFGFRLPDEGTTAVHPSHATPSSRSLGTALSSLSGSTADMSRRVPSAPPSRSNSTAPTSRSGSAAPTSRYHSTAPTSRSASVSSQVPKAFPSQASQLRIQSLGVHRRSSVVVPARPLSPADIPSRPRPRPRQVPAYHSSMQIQAPPPTTPFQSDLGPEESQLADIFTDNDSPEPRPAGSRRLRRAESYFDNGDEDLYSQPRQCQPQVGMEPDLDIDEISPGEEDDLAERFLHDDAPDLPPVDSDGQDEVIMAEHNLRHDTQALARTGSSHQDEDVVVEHHRRNRGSRLPTTVELDTIRDDRRVATTDAMPSSWDLEDNPDQPSQPPVSTQASRRQGRGRSHGGQGDDPSQLQYYTPTVRDILERAKAISRCDAASLNAYPSRAWFATKAPEYVNEAIMERIKKTLPIPTGWWPENSEPITKMLWEDLTNWRSALKKRARVFVAERYDWDPEKRQQVNAEIAVDLLADGGAFHRCGVDADGHTNNLAHPALDSEGLILDFFYTGPNSVGALFTEVFEREVPRVAVALSVTALKSALRVDEIAHAESTFKVQKYQDFYLSVLDCMSKCDTHPVHKEKTRSLRVEWARIGSNAHASISSTAQNTFQVVLD